MSSSSSAAERPSHSSPSLDRHPANSAEARGSHHHENDGRASGSEGEDGAESTEDGSGRDGRPKAGARPGKAHERAAGQAEEAAARLVAERNRHLAKMRLISKGQQGDVVARMSCLRPCHCTYEVGTHGATGTPCGEDFS